MRKVIAKLLVGIMLISVLVSGCGDKKEENGNVGDIQLTRAEDVLVYTWSAYDDKDRFGIVGGDLENEMIGSMGEFNIEEVDEMDYVLGIPEKAVKYVENAASMKDEMDAYTFTSGAFYITDSENVKDFLKLVKENIMDKVWPEGEPEKLIIATVSENYVVVAFGLEDKVDTFKTNLKSATGAKIVTNMNLNQ